MSMSMKEVAVRAGREVLMGLDNNSSLILGDLQGILRQELRPHPIHSILLV